MIMFFAYHVWKFIMNRVLERVRSVMMPIVIKTVKGIEIPDIKQDMYNVSNIKITKFDIAESLIRMEENDVIKVFLNKISIGVTLDWGYNAVLVWDSGNANITTDGALAMVTARLGFDLKTYTPTVKVTDTDFNVGELEIRLGGGVSGAIVNVLTTLLQNQIRDLINSSVGPILGTTIEDILRDNLQANQELFRKIFFGLIAFVVALISIFIYFYFFKKSPPSPDTAQQITDNSTNSSVEENTSP